MEPEIFLVQFAKKMPNSPKKSLFQEDVHVNILVPIKTINFAKGELFWLPLSGSGPHLILKQGNKIVFGAKSIVPF